ncbi:MAG TPA: hypothetical protein GX707_01720 [Epulopiscium sp.]|nr:hypothetical protein [Candidatus Epulonipiscium sp.]
MAKIKEIIGCKFGKLTVLNISKTRGNSGQIKYDCICDCGNTHTVSGESIRSGKSKSCGCLRKAYVPKTFNKNRKQQILIQLYKSTIEKRSKKKGWIDCIGLELFTKLSLANCHYCNTEPTSKICDRRKDKDKTLISNDFVLVNGIDRVDSSKGYVEDNVVPCCKYCNTAKNTMSDSEFREWIKKIYAHYIK